jgi:hypothetical protein
MIPLDELRKKKGCPRKIMKYVCVEMSDDPSE